MTKTKARLTLNYIRGLGNGTISPPDKTLGICHALRETIKFDGLEQYIGGWSKFSGRWAYPVPHPTLGAEAAFYDILNLWQDDEYGDNRRELCLFIADQLEKELENDLVNAEQWLVDNNL